MRHFFFANDDLHERCRAYLREHCAEAYLHYYDNEGRLRPEFRATDEASALYNLSLIHISPLRAQPPACKPTETIPLATAQAGMDYASFSSAF